MKQGNEQAPGVQEAMIWRLADAGKMREAIAACAQLNRNHPEYAPGWRTASILAQRAGNREAALQVIGRAVALEPDNPEWSLQQAYCLMQLGRTVEARPLLEWLSEASLGSGYQYATLALLLSRLGLHGLALDKYRCAAELEPGESQYHYNAATVQRFLGDIDGAQASLSRALALNPRDIDAHKLNADLKRQTPDDNHVATLESLLESGIDDARGKAEILHALAKELEDLDAYESSFARLQEGAALRRKLMRYDVSGDVETMDTIRRQFNRDWLENVGEGFASSAPIFVLGLPRTGTTLVERMLDSHPLVRSVGELNDFALQMSRLARVGVGDARMDKRGMVERSTGLDFRELGQAYLASAQPGDGGENHFIDKMPLNFLYIGLIGAALPGARIVHLRRHPMDACYAIFKTSFQQAYPFSYDLTELGEYYLAYHRLMVHWRELLPGLVFDVDYEQLVREPRSQLESLLDYCGLDWDAACLQFHDNPSASTTASASQVREPLHARSVGKWRRLREPLADLAAQLRAGGVKFDD